MSWYTKYLAVYEKSFPGFPEETFTEVRKKLQALQSEKPLVTVSVIAYNEEKHLLACLWSLSEMKCKYPVEIIGVNNDSKDHTAEIFRLTGLPFYTEYQHSCGFARTCGLNHARGKYHLNIDADTLYPPRYVETMVKELEKPGTMGVSSLWSYIPDASHPWLGLKIYEFMRDTHLWLQSFKRPELSVRGLVFGYNTEFARKVGIRTDIIRGEDGSLALGLKKYGKIRFLHKRKARAITGYGTVSADGSFFNSFKVRIIKYLKGMKSYFTSREKYDDDESNLVK